eukprot:3379951-Rhodomonas_salina.2
MTPPGCGLATQILDFSLQEAPLSLGSEFQLKEAWNGKGEREAEKAGGRNGCSTGRGIQPTTTIVPGHAMVTLSGTDVSTVITRYQRICTVDLNRNNTL